MSEMTTPESRARLGYLLSEMLSLPNLPADLHQVISDHLQRQLGLVNILKPEYCLRLYPVLAELAELTARDNESQSSADVLMLDEEDESINGETLAETVNGATNDQADHFGLSSTEREPLDERPKDF